MKLKHILALLAIILVVGAIIGYRMYNKPHEDLARATPDYTLEAKALFSAYESSEEEANTRYLDKIIQVKGEILEVNIDASGQTSLTLDAGGMLGGVVCQLDKSIGQDGFKQGDRIRLNGLCTGMLMDVVLVRCKPV